MSKAMQLVGIIILGIFTLAIIYLMSDFRSTNELDYYLLQEVTEASMYDAVDFSDYRATGHIKVDRDMFLESFNRRFAESVSDNRDYDIKIIDFNETPPKVSIEVKTKTIASFNSERAVVTTRVSGILETIHDDFIYSRGAYGKGSNDTTSPNVTYEHKGGNTYTITLTDDLSLGDYTTVTFGSGKAQEAAQAAGNWQAILGYKRTYTFTTNLTAGNGESNYIVVRDLAGNVASKEIADRHPQANYIIKDGVLSSTVCDDRGFSGFWVAKKDTPTMTIPNSHSSPVKETKKTSKDGAIFTCYEMSNVNVENWESGDYIIHVVENSGRTTDFDLPYEKPKPQPTATPTATPTEPPEQVQDNRCYKYWVSYKKDKNGNYTTERDESTLVNIGITECPWPRTMCGPTGCTIWESV